MLYSQGDKVREITSSQDVQGEIRDVCRIDSKEVEHVPAHD